MTILLIISQLLGLVALGALIWLVVRAGRQHVLWAVAVLLLSPIAAIIFAIKHWQAAKRPFLLYISSVMVSITLALVVFVAWGGAEVIRTATDVNSGIHDEDLTEDQALAFMRANLDFMGNSNPSAEDQAKIDSMRRFLDHAEAGYSEENQRKMAAEVLGQIDPGTLDEEGRRHYARMRREFMPRADDDAAGNTQGQVASEPPAKSPPRRPPRPVAPRWEYMNVDPQEAVAHVGASVKVVGGNGTERHGKLTAVDGNTLHITRRMYGGSVEYQLELGEVQSFKVRKRVS